MIEPSNDLDSAGRDLVVEGEAPDSIESVAATVAYLRASWRNRTKQEVDRELDSIATRLMDLAQTGARVMSELLAFVKGQVSSVELTDSPKLEIPFTLTYFREARDIGRQWARERYEQEAVHLRVSAIFDATWVEPNARMLLGLEVDDVEGYSRAHDRASYELATGWVRDLSTVIARAATREYKKLAKGQMR